MEQNKADPETPNLADKIRQDILTGNLPAGAWLKQADIEAKYSANRFEVRIALSDLSARKMITHIPNRGYRVINPTDREREELYEVRTILEISAAKMAIQHSTEEDIHRLSLLVEQFSESVESKSKDYLMELNVEFHDEFYALSKNELLTQEIKDLRDRGLPGRKGSWDTLSGIRASCEDHARMVDMLKKKDPEGMSYVVYRHLNRWREFSSPN